MLSFCNMSGLVGVMAETKRGLFEVHLDKNNDVHFFFNSVKKQGLPLEGNEAVIAKLFKCFEKHRMDMLAYLVTNDNALWWKLKEAIGPA